MNETDMLLILHSLLCKLVLLIVAYLNCITQLELTCIYTRGVLHHITFIANRIFFFILMLFFNNIMRSLIRVKGRYSVA